MLRGPASRRITRSRDCAIRAGPRSRQLPVRCRRLFRSERGAVLPSTSSRASIFFGRGLRPSTLVRSDSMRRLVAFRHAAEPRTWCANESAPRLCRTAALDKINIDCSTSTESVVNTTSISRCESGNGSKRTPDLCGSTSNGPSFASSLITRYETKRDSIWVGCWRRGRRGDDPGRKGRAAVYRTPELLCPWPHAEDAPP